MYVNLNCPPPIFSELKFPTRVALALSILICLFVSACGGGGAASSDASIDGLLQSSTGSSQASSTARSVSNSRPNFNFSLGSITQSSNYGGASNTATDTASTSFNGSNVSVAISRQGSSTLTFNSATDTYSSYSIQGLTIPGFRYKGHELIVETNNSLSGADVLVAWSNSDPTDYLAAGYWLHFTGNLSNQQITSVEVGAFANGPELAGKPTLPNTGTASYRGLAAGIFAARLGSYSPELQGTVTIGDYSAPITLSVNFLNQSISGCIGCDGEVEVEGFAVSPNGEYVDYFVTGDPGEIRLRLGAASINSNDGTFTGGNLTWEEDNLPVGLTAVSTSGYWGGKFSTKSDANGVPRLVAGTNSAYTKYSDGSEEEFVGAFVAAKQ